MSNRKNVNVEVEDLNENLLDDAINKLNNALSGDERRSIIINTTLHYPEVAEMVEKWIKGTMEKYISIMPNGRFRNHHNGKFENCDGIVLLASGDVCPIFKTDIACLNPLKIYEDNDYASLSTFSVAGRIIGLYDSIGKTVEKYNSDLGKQMAMLELSSLGKYAIVGYHSFIKGW